MVVVFLRAVRDVYEADAIDRWLSLYAYNTCALDGCKDISRKG
jgi:hypothetical protein